VLWFLRLTADTLLRTQPCSLNNCDRGSDFNTANCYHLAGISLVHGRLGHTSTAGWFGAQGGTRGLTSGLHTAGDCAARVEVMQFSGLQI
jgi:hypothetical protein